ncbi:zf-HC2 domain-containing protein [Streptomyces sp. NPDC002994]|uniref:zf-HC2 domain-containing protein n=1 Tax=Streptomyces sp. NPDC002994 TaxID=3154441 RepID=UPI00339E3C50
MTGGHVELLLGAYVLDALPAAEDAEVASHLGQCDLCRTAYLEVADAAALLALFSADDLAAGPDGV